MYTVLLVLLILVSLVMCTAILLQAGQGGGLASLGGGAGTEMVMGGRQATTLLHTITWWCGSLFLFLSLILAVMSSHSGTPRSVLEGGADQQPAPVQQAPLPIQSSPAPAPANPPAQQTPNR
jgi:preprotein translocase subunit SecG